MDLSHLMLDHGMTPEDLSGLRDCCRSDAAFEHMQQILLKTEAIRQQMELQTLELLGDQIRSAISAADHGQYLKSLEALIVERTTELLTTHERLQQEMAERQWAEKALHESEQRFRSLIENATDIVVILDERGVFHYCSPSAERILGYRLPDVVGRSATEFVHPDDVDLILRVLEAAMQQPRQRQPAIDYRVRHHDGSWCLFEAVATSLLDDPAGGGVVINCHDITERKRAEEALRQQAERERLVGAIAQRIRQSLNLEDILNTTVVEVQQCLAADRVVICRIEPDGQGWVIAEASKQGHPSSIGLKLQDPWFRKYQSNFSQGQPLVTHNAQQATPETDIQQFLTKNQIKAALVMPILNGDQLWGVLGITQHSAVRTWEVFETDLLEQLATQVAIAIQQADLYCQVQQLNAKLEAEVQERTAQLQRALDFEAMLKRITDSVRDSLDEDIILQTAVQELALGLGVWGCDAALHNLGQHTTTIHYEFLSSPLLPSVKGTIVQMSAFVDIYAQLLQGRHVQFCRIIPDPVRSIEARCAVLACPIADDQDILGNLWLFKPCEQAFEPQEIRVVQQVTNQCAIALRQARLYQAAQAQVAALEDLNQLKDDFLSTVSHELRTPVSNMKLAIHMLRQVPDLDRQRRYLDILQSECAREIELINDLLDLQRLEASAYPVFPEVIDLHQFLPELIVPFQSRSRERQQTLMVDIPADLPAIVTDRASLERILAELLNNACKYTSPGSAVRLTVRAMTASEPNPPHLVFTVHNQAEILPTELPRIFEKFYRVPDNDRWKQGGTGLGLALVQKLVVQLGGCIQVHSQDGWTSFSVQLAGVQRSARAT